MKKLLVAILLSLGFSSVVLAYHLPAAYRAAYCYPGGSYWAAQVAAYPAYYAANNVYYQANYGASTIYCP